ncbi:PAXX protein, partial [Corythaixoides concolor]|nr:PAXX protein [Corythaixoides concolor]
MAEPAGSFHLLQAGPGRYLCYCRPGPGPGGTVYVTDALEVWAGELGARPPLGCVRPPSPWPRLRRDALGRGAASLSLGQGKAALQPREEARCSALELIKLPSAEARSQLQALVFGMAEHVKSLERRLEGAWWDLEGGKGRRRVGRELPPSRYSIFPHPKADPNPRKSRAAGSALPAKRKIPGESLINPGFKSKKAPSGVDFEDS